MKDQYQSMCMEAEEIQNDWEEKFGEFIPNQEWLQQHEGSRPAVQFGLFKEFVWDHTSFTSHARKYFSWNEMWLAFVMYRLYNKTWDKSKKEWVTIH